MSAIRTRRQAARLRARILEDRRVQREITAIHLRMATKQIQDLRYQLSPEHRLKLQAALASWEAAKDSLEDDGVFPEPKGSY